MAWLRLVNLWQPFAQLTSGGLASAEAGRLPATFGSNALTNIKLDSGSVPVTQSILAGESVSLLNA